MLVALLPFKPRHGCGVEPPRLLGFRETRIKCFLLARVVAIDIVLIDTITNRATESRIATSHANIKAVRVLHTLNLTCDFALDKRSGLPVPVGAEDDLVPTALLHSLLPPQWSP